ncbi:uncharacterized protein [Blastocystis hominis]|uniref:Eukaryotic translation initiation factor 3 subunit D n=1 Tax=Blastocystis hominis TaxID=12968 RepID=D8M5U7_BLAHO|nr:uncharacterized protein [Blastocystis hominis]CBK23546.2 unnamed protein product [Blastocystis hominis]|eukprot:XP_012897594.1 uncharacterized protein [Blastocystis hominis]
MLSGMQRLQSNVEQNDGDFVKVDKMHTPVSHKSKLLHTKTKANYNANNANQAASGGKGRSSQKKGASQYQRRNYDFLHLPSITIKSTWPSLFQVDFRDLAQLTLKTLPAVSEFASCGSYNTYNPLYDSVNLKKTAALEDHAASGDLKVTSVMKDPFIAQLVNSKAAQIYTTDVALSQLMVAIRSQLSWDLEVIKNENGLFISHRDGVFDQYSVNETSADLPTEEENKNNCLWKEVTDINRDFAKQIMTSEVTACEFPSPFPDDNPEKINRMYRYRKFTLSDGQVLLVRTEVHGVQTNREKPQLLNAYAVNEWCNRTPLTNRWRSKLAASPGYALTEDMKNNNYRLSKWGVQAVLAGVDLVKIGYVSRRKMDDINSGHVILGVQNFSLETFKKQIMLNEQNMWAVVEYFVKLLSKEENGHYILMKDPLKGFIRVYRVPESEVEAMETQTLSKEESESESESESEYSEYSEYSDYSGYSYSDEE